MVTVSCRDCGSEVRESSYCSACGVRLQPAAAAPTPPSFGLGASILPAAPSRETPGQLASRLVDALRAQPARATAVAVIALAAMGVLANVGGLPGLPIGRSEHVLRGTFVLTDYDAGWDEGDYCSGSSGYADVRGGLQVIVSDGAGEVLATSALEEGIAGPGVILDDAVRCEFAFRVPAVADADFYRIEVGRRGDLTYSRSEMESRHWTVDLALGGSR